MCIYPIFAAVASELERLLELFSSDDRMGGLVKALDQTSPTSVYLEGMNRVDARISFQVFF